MEICLDLSTGAAARRLFPEAVCNTDQYQFILGVPWVLKDRSNALFNFGSENRPSLTLFWHFSVTGAWGMAEEFGSAQNPRKSPCRNFGWKEEDVWGRGGDLGIAVYPDGGTKSVCGYLLRALTSKLSACCDTGHCWDCFTAAQEGKELISHILKTPDFQNEHTIY